MESTSIQLEADMVIILYLALFYLGFCALTFGILCYTLSKDTGINMLQLKTYGSIVFASVMPGLNLLVLYGAILTLLEVE